MTDAIERAARATRHITRDVLTMDEHRDLIRHALASLRPGMRITLADGTECWIAPMEATEQMLEAGRCRPFREDDADELNLDRNTVFTFGAMRDACKEDEG